MSGDRTHVTKILMVEDHVFFSQAFELVLARSLSEEPSGASAFFHAATIAEGLRLVAEEGPFGLAVVDLMLPDGNGTEVVRAIKASSPGTTVAVLSSVEDLSGAIEAGADEAIRKGDPLPEIIAILERLASGGDRATV